MNAPRAVKIPALVGVITSMAELRAALRMRVLPDLFELRLDYLPELEFSQARRLRQPLIITARHFEEGGNRISASRRDLLLNWLPAAKFVDVELRSLRQLRAVWDEAARMHIKRICSVHDFARTPGHAALLKQFQRAKKAGAHIFKLVTRAETPDDLLTLLKFLRRARGQCCVVATGKFGPFSRLLFPECGSLLIYAPLLRPLYPGQLTLQQLRRLRDFYAKR